MLRKVLHDIRYECILIVRNAFYARANDLMVIDRDMEDYYGRTSYLSLSLPNRLRALRSEYVGVILLMIGLRITRRYL